MANGVNLNMHLLRNDSVWQLRGFRCCEKVVWGGRQVHLGRQAMTRRCRAMFGCCLLPLAFAGGGLSAMGGRLGLRLLPFGMHMREAEMHIREAWTPACKTYARRPQCVRTEAARRTSYPLNSLNLGA